MSNEAPKDETAAANTSQAAGEKDAATAKLTIESTTPITAEVKAAKPDDSNLPPPKPPKRWQTLALGLYLIGLGALLGYLLLKLWANPAKDGEVRLIGFFWGFIVREIQPDARLLGIAMAAGALGSFFHAAKSFTAYVGNRTIYLSWFWWYLLRPFAGAALGTIFYLILRAGMFPGQGDSNQISMYGVAAMAGLAGMFADQAALKLEELFTTLFKAEDPRRDKLDEASKAAAGGSLKPQIKSINPPQVTAAKDVDVVVTGANFDAKAVVTLNGKELKATAVTATELKMSLKAADIPSPGEFNLIVVNPKGGPSDAAKLKVVA
ncbi:MAG TPA: IPT/TIG domain-containing protein [Blastocatellia bacterium]|nr:IPT/TIG domain-containing protein [Blastocatellia bacterium]